MLKYIALFLMLTAVLAFMFSNESPTKELVTGGSGKAKFVKVVIKKVVTESPSLSMDVELGRKLSLVKGSAAPPIIMIRSYGLPPRYIKLASYDTYAGNVWLLNLSSEHFIINMSIRVVKRGSSCYIVDEAITNSSPLEYVRYFVDRVRMIACFGAGGAYSKLLLGGATTLKLGNYTLLPLPPNFLTVSRSFRGGRMESSALALLLTRVVPIPTGMQGNITLAIDLRARFAILLSGNVKEVLILKSPPPPPALDMALGTAAYVGRICSGGKPGSGCAALFYDLVRRAICSEGTSYVTLGAAISKLTRAIRSKVTYGPVDMSKERLRCGDYTLDFLFTTRRGTCLHYASALALALRVVGYDTRVTTGLVRVNYVGLGNGEYVALYAPHAWTEVVTPFGYVMSDPTPPTSRHVPASIVVKELTPVASGAPTYMEAEPYPGIKVMLGKLRKGSTAAAASPVEIISSIVTSHTEVLLYLSAALILTYLLINYRGLAALISSLVFKVLARIRKRGCSLLVMEALMTVYSYLGVKAEPHLTLRELVRSIEERLPEDLRYLLLRLVSTYERYRYGEDLSAEPEVRRLVNEVMRLIG